MGEFFITVHMCLSFIKPTVQLWNLTHLEVQLYSEFNTALFGLSWHLD